MRSLVALVLLLGCSVASAEIVGSATVSGNSNFSVSIPAGTYRVKGTIYGKSTTDPAAFGVNNTGGTGYSYSTNGVDSWHIGNLTLASPLTATWQFYENLTGSSDMVCEIFPVSVSTVTLLGSSGSYVPFTVSSSASWGAWSSASSSGSAYLTIMTGNPITYGMVIQMETTYAGTELVSWRYRVMSNAPVAGPNVIVDPPPGGGGGSTTVSPGDGWRRDVDEMCPPAESFSEYERYPVQWSDDGGWAKFNSLDEAIAANPRYLWYGKSTPDFWGVYPAAWHGRDQWTCDDEPGGGGDCCDCLTQEQFEESLNKWITRTEVAKLLSDVDLIQKNTADSKTYNKRVSDTLDEEKQKNYQDYLGEMQQSISFPTPTAEPVAPDVAVPVPVQTDGAWRSILLSTKEPLERQFSSEPAGMSLSFPALDLGSGIILPAFEFADDESHFGELWETWNTWRIAFRTGMLAIVAFGATIYLIYLAIQWVPES